MESQLEAIETLEKLSTKRAFEEALVRDMSALEHAMAEVPG